MTENKTVLVIDDDRIVREMVAKVLGEYGVQAVVVSDGKEGRERLLEAIPFDLILVDLIIPQMSGWDILEMIENAPERMGTPVIVITGVALSSGERRRLLERVNAVVDKNSFTLEKFRGVLESCCVL